jgi:uncharacterized membrane protein YhiD involved in acid resistance
VSWASSVDLWWISVGVGVLVDFGVILEGVFGVILRSVLSAAINAFNQGRASIKWSSG